MFYNGGLEKDIRRNRASISPLFKVEIGKVVFRRYPSVFCGGKGIRVGKTVVNNVVKEELQDGKLHLNRRSRW